MNLGNFRNQFPNFNLEDKVVLNGEGIAGNTKNDAEIEVRRSNRLRHTNRN